MAVKNQKNKRIGKVYALDTSSLKTDDHSPYVTIKDLDYNRESVIFSFFRNGMIVRDKTKGNKS